MKKERDYKGVVVLLLFLAGGILFYLVPSLNDFFNPNSLAFSSGFAAVFIQICFVPEILLTNLLGLFLVQGRKESKGRIEVIRLLLIGNSILVGLALLLFLSLAFGGADLLASFTAFVEVPAISQSLLAATGPQILFIVIYMVQLKKEKQLQSQGT